MNELHSLLKRQLRRFQSGTKSSILDQTDLLRAINDAYLQFDADRKMLEHSLELTSQELLERNAELSRINAELELRVAARTEELSANEARFRGLFEHAPVSIWEEDFSEVRNYIDNLRNAGAVDLSAYFDTHPEEIAECTARVKIVDVNRATLDMYQAESKAQLLADLSRIVGPESLSSFKEELLALARGETIFEAELINYTLRGEKRVVFLRLTVAPGCEQNWARVFVGISDITQRRRAEAALAVERDLLQALMDNIPDTIYFKDTASRFTRINLAQAKVLGVAAPKDAIDKMDFDFQASDLAQEFYKEEQHLIETGQPLIDRLEFNPTAAGEPRWFSATKVPIKDENGRVTGIVGVSRDITTHKLGEMALQESEAEIRALFAAIQDIIVIYDRDARYVQIAPTKTGQMNTPPELMLGKTVFDVFPPVLARTFFDAIQEVLQSQESIHIEYQLEIGGQAVWKDAVVAPRTKDTVFWIAHDISERKQIEEIIRNQNEMFASLHSITLDLLSYREINPLLNALVDLAAKFLDAPYAEIMLIEGEVLVVKAATQNQHHLIDIRAGRQEALLSWKAFDTREPAVVSDYASWPHRQDIYNDFLLQAVADFPILNDDQCLGVLALGRDKPGYEFNRNQIQYGRLFANLTALVLHSAQLREALREQSIRDPLTDLLNRRGFFQLGKVEFSRSRRTNRSICCMMLDLDHFKKINDDHGHQTGDQILREFALRCKDSIREIDLIGRYGGEELIILMPETGIETATQVAERLRSKACDQKITVGDQVLSITVSIGVATRDENTSDLETLIARADQAMYIAKHKGRNRVAVSK